MTMSPTTTPQRPTSGVPGASGLALATLLLILWSLLVSPVHGWLQIGRPRWDEWQVTFFKVESGVEVLLGLMILAATVTFAQACRGRPHAALAWASVAAQGLYLAFSALGLIEQLGGTALLPDFRSPARTALMIVEVLAAYAAEVCLFLALLRSLPRPSPALAAVFWGALALSLVLFALGRLDEFRLFLRDSPLGFAVFLVRRTAFLARESALGLAAFQVSREGGPIAGDAAPAAPAAPVAAPSASGDLVAGVLALGLGLVVTVVSYSMAAKAGGGHYLIATGAISVGLVRLVRGAVRLGRGR